MVRGLRTRARDGLDLDKVIGIISAAGGRSGMLDLYGQATLERDFTEGETSRRAFLRGSTLLGVSVAAAYVFVGTVTDAEAATSTKDVTDAEGPDAVNAETEIASRRRPGGYRSGRSKGRRGKRGGTVSAVGGDIQFANAMDIDFT